MKRTLLQRETTLSVMALVRNIFISILLSHFSLTAVHADSVFKQQLDQRLARNLKAKSLVESCASNKFLKVNQIKEAVAAYNYFYQLDKAHEISENCMTKKIIDSLYADIKKRGTFAYEEWMNGIAQASFLSIGTLQPLLIELTELYTSLYSSKIGKHQVARKALEDWYNENKVLVGGGAVMSLAALYILAKNGGWQKALAKLPKFRRQIFKSVRGKAMSTTTTTTRSTLTATGTRAGSVSAGSTAGSNKVVGGEENGILDEEFDYVPMSPLSYVFDHDSRSLELSYEEQRMIRTNVAILSGIGVGYLASKMIEPFGERWRQNFTETRLRGEATAFEKKVYNYLDRKKINSTGIITKIGKTPFIRIASGVGWGLVVQIGASIGIDKFHEFTLDDTYFSVKSEFKSFFDEIKSKPRSLKREDVLKSLYLMEKWYIRLQEYTLYYTGEYRNLRDAALSDYYQSSLCFKAFEEFYYRPAVNRYISRSHSKEDDRIYKGYLNIILKEYNSFHIPAGQSSIQPTQKSVITKMSESILKNKNQDVSHGKFIPIYLKRFRENYTNAAMDFEESRSKYYQEIQGFLDDMKILRKMTSQFTKIDNLLNELQTGMETTGFNCCSSDIDLLVETLRKNTEISNIERLYDGGAKNLYQLEKEFKCKDTPYYRQMNHLELDELTDERLAP